MDDEKPLRCQFVIYWSVRRPIFRPCSCYIVEQSQRTGQDSITVRIIEYEHCNDKRGGATE
jgi:hypothetical protein